MESVITIGDLTMHITGQKGADKNTLTFRPKDGPLAIRTGMTFLNYKAWLVQLAMAGREWECEMNEANRQAKLG